MYITNQANNRIIKIEDVKLSSRYPKEVTKELGEIFIRLASKAFNENNMNKYDEEIKRQQEIYLADKSKEHYIIVNGVVFGTYDNEITAINEFLGIKEAMRNGSISYNL